MTFTKRGRVYQIIRPEELSQYFTNGTILRANKWVVVLTPADPPKSYWKQLWEDALHGPSNRTTLLTDVCLASVGDVIEVTVEPYIDQDDPHLTWMTHEVKK